MDSILPYLSALIVGLFGGVHCVGMCGGLVSALSLSHPQGEKTARMALLPLLLGYNLGRILSYSVAGTLMGGIGLLFAQSISLQLAQKFLLMLSGGLMILIGLYLGRFWMALSHIEHLGRHLWQTIQPLATRLIPIKNPWQAIIVGLLWGWLPCGLVYSMLITAATSGGSVEGALLMFSFALGTLPNLLAIGLLSAEIRQLISRPAIYHLAGISVIIFGLFNIWRAI